MTELQRVDTWWAMRLGKVTASRVAEVMAKGKGATRDNYMSELICERLTGEKATTFSSAAMDRGTELEPVAKTAYSAFKGELVEDVGFIQHPTIEMAGASPDGFVGDEGLCEVKIPNTATHLEYLLENKPPARYVAQMQWQMACTGRQWCDFVSYDNRLPEHLQLLVVRVPRDDNRIAELEAEVTKFLTELEDKLKKLQERNRE